MTTLSGYSRQSDIDETHLCIPTENKLTSMVIIKGRNCTVHNYLTYQPSCTKIEYLRWEIIELMRWRDCTRNEDFKIYKATQYLTILTSKKKVFENKELIATF